MTQGGVPQSWIWAWNKGWPHTTHLSHCSQSASYAGYSLQFSGKLSVPYTHIKMLEMGNLLFSHSSSAGLSLQPDSTSKSCPHSSGCYRSRTQVFTEGRSRPETPHPKDTKPAGYWSAHWAYRTSVPAGPPATGTDVPPPQREYPLPLAPVPARVLVGDPESGDESPPLQGETALPSAQDPDAHYD